jgi:hypothetical protein
MKIRTNNHWYQSKAPWELSKKDVKKVGISLDGDEIIIRLPEFIFTEFPSLRRCLVLHRFHPINIVPMANRDWTHFMPITFWMGLILFYDYETSMYKIGIYYHDTEIQIIHAGADPSETAKKAWKTRRGDKTTGA